MVKKMSRSMSRSSMSRSSQNICSVGGTVPRGVGTQTADGNGLLIMGAGGSRNKVTLVPGRSCAWKHQCCVGSFTGLGPGWDRVFCDRHFFALDRDVMVQLQHPGIQLPGFVPGFVRDVI